MGIQGVRFRGGAVMAASFVVGVVLLFCELQLGDAINVGESSYFELPAARRLLNRPAQPDGIDVHGALILGQLVDQAPPTAPKFGRRFLDFSTSGSRRGTPKGYPPTPGKSRIITPPPAAPVRTPPPAALVRTPPPVAPVRTPPPPTHIYNPPPPPPY